MISLEDFIRRAIGIPFVDHGRDYDGWDCWGLVVRAWREVRGVILPDFQYEGVTNYRELARLFNDRSGPRFVSAEPVPMALACIWRRGLPIHAGLVVPGRRIMHVEEGVETCLEPISAFRVEGFYEPASRRAASV